jgi:Holliday junction resolvasome RuvABC ATP-dependent DNA helicase subunit
MYDINVLNTVERMFFDEKICIDDIALVIGESVFTVDMMLCEILSKITPSGDTLSE